MVGGLDCVGGDTCKVLAKNGLLIGNVASPPSVWMIRGGGCD